MGSIGDNQASLFGSVRNLKDTVLLNVGTGSQVSLVTERFIECSGSVELRPCTEKTAISSWELPVWWSCVCDAGTVLQRSCRN